MMLQSIDRFLQTKLFGLIWTLTVYFAACGMFFALGKRIGYDEGWKQGMKANPKPAVMVISEYVFDGHHIARFDPRTPDVFLLFDFDKKEIARVPFDMPFKKAAMGNKEPEQNKGESDAGKRGE